MGDRLRRKTPNLLVIAGVVRSALLISSAATLLLVAALYLVWRGLYSASMPLTKMLIADVIPLDVRSISYSSSMIVSNLVGLVSLMAVTWFIEDSGIQAVFPISRARLGVSLLLILLFRPK